MSVEVAYRVEGEAERTSLLDTLRRRLDRTAYRAQQYAIMLPIATVRRIAATVWPSGEQPDQQAVAAVQQRYQDLLERDLRNVEEGLYPRELLFQIPVVAYARAVPTLLADIPRVVRRVLAGNWRDLPAEVDVARYPSYFRRNFHWQTDGYFSRRSAELYDFTTELLFAGTTDVMRRQVIPPITRYLRLLAPEEPGGQGEAARAGAGNGARPDANGTRRGGGRDESEGGGRRRSRAGGAGGHPADRRDPRDLRLLDVACGTGRTLAQIAVAHPGLKLYGVDLSPYYLQVARRVLAEVPDVSLVAENAERLPFREGFFDVVISVYLFHELPRATRRRVLDEMHRVLRPGGLLVIEDSAQLAESGNLAHYFARFAADFHEPFYKDYVGDDLADALADAGFRVASAAPQFVSKVLVAYRE